jgi:hypothetical protein
MAFLRALYLLFGLAVIGGYAYATWSGLETKKAKQQLAASGVRGTTGGGGVIYYRGGYRGGK